MIWFLSFGSVGFEMEDIFNWTENHLQKIWYISKLSFPAFLACSSVVRKDISDSVHDIVS